MLSVTGNPSMENLSAIFMGINRKLNVRIETKVVKKGKGKSLKGTRDQACAQAG